MSEQNYYTSSGGYLPSSQQQYDSPGGRKREGLSNSLRPVTIRQILKATHAHTDADWYFEGQEMLQVTVVAQVVQISKQATNVAILLDDGTGRIEARHWADSSSAGREDPDDQWGDLVENSTFARITGSLKAFNQKRYINATHMRVVKDPHEPYFHILEAIYATVALDRGPPNLKDLHGQAAPQQGGHSAYTTDGASHAQNEYAQLPPLKRKIIEFILKEPDTKDGVHIQVILRGVGGDMDSLNLALEDLRGDGFLYTTFDESHFKVGA